MHPALCTLHPAPCTAPATLPFSFSTQSKKFFLQYFSLFKGCYTLPHCHIRVKVAAVDVIVIYASVCVRVRGVPVYTIYTLHTYTYVCVCIKMWSFYCVQKTFRKSFFNGSVTFRLIERERFDKMAISVVYSDKVEK